MIWTPISLAVFAMDAVGVALILAASKTAADVLVGWDPGSASRKQLRLEIAGETASIKAGAGTAVLFISTLVFLSAICNAFPEIVPGAMCGTGVMNAAGGWGERALFFRMAAVGLLLLKSETEKIDRTRPDSPLALGNARLLLLALPLVLFAIHATFKTINGMDVQQPVDCCAVVYDSVRSGEDLSAFEFASDRTWVASYLAGGVLMLFAGAILCSFKDSPSPKTLFSVAAICSAWAVAASVALTRVLASYHYQVLNHHCPWCMFLSEHNLAGYPLFGTLAFALFESYAAFAAALTGASHPLLKNAADARIAKAGRRLCFSVSLFILLSGLPPLLWRLKYGVWIGG